MDRPTRCCYLLRYDVHWSAGYSVFILLAWPVMPLSDLQAISGNGNQKSDVGFFWSWSYWSTFILAWYVSDHKGLCSFFFRVQRPVFCSRPSKIVADLQCSKIWNGIAAVVCVSSDNMACTLHNVNVVSNCWISIELLTAKFVSALFLKEKMVSVYWIFFSQLDKLDPLRWPIALHSTSSTIRGQKWSNPDIQIGMLFSLSGYHIGVNSHWHKKSSY